MLDAYTQGGKTGLTAIVVSFYFLISVFFAPLLASVPPWATGPALIIVGAMMMRGVVEIDWEKHSEAIPAFVTIAIMPLTYSIAYGIIGGLFSWLVINVVDVLISVARGEETDFLSGLVTRALGKPLDAVEETAKPPAPAPQAWPQPKDVFSNLLYMHAKISCFWKREEQANLQMGFMERSCLATLCRACVDMQRMDAKREERTDALVCNDVGVSGRRARPR